MGTENRDWGYTRIQGAIANVGHGVGRGTLANLLMRNGGIRNDHAGDTMNDD